MSPWLPRFSKWPLQVRSELRGFIVNVESDYRESAPTHIDMNLIVSPIRRGCIGFAPTGLEQMQPGIPHRFSLPSQAAKRPALHVVVGSANQHNSSAFPYTGNV